MIYKLVKGSIRDNVRELKEATTNDIVCDVISYFLENSITSKYIDFIVIPYVDQVREIQKLRYNLSRCGFRLNVYRCDELIRICVTEI